MVGRNRLLQIYAGALWQHQGAPELMCVIQSRHESNHRRELEDEPGELCCG